MKRWLILIPLTLSLVLAGCGGSGTRARGRVVDQNGVGIAGVVVTLGTSYTTTTSRTGDYYFSSLVAGTYTLAAAGGDGGHYLSKPADVTIVDQTNNNLGTTTAYRLLGIGVIVQSTTKSKAFSGGGIAPALKEIVPAKSPVSRNKPTVRATARAVTPEFLAGNAAFIYLDWEAIDGADSYEVYLYGKGSVKVWDSDDTHDEDPGYDSGAPEAYLDLTNELAPYISSAGTYSFKVVALDAVGATLLELPNITVSLGQTLEAYPGLAETGCLNPVTHELIWTPVTNASGYRVWIRNDTGTIPVTDSGMTLLATTSYTLSGLTEGTYYQCRVDAQYLDATGWPAEITRGINGFTY